MSGRSWVVAAVVVGCAVASCGKSSGGADNSGVTDDAPMPYANGAGTLGEAGALAGAGSPTENGANGGAAPASEGGGGGMAPNECEPATPPICVDDTAIKCTPEGALSLETCAEGFSCISDALGARCEEQALLTVGSEPNDFGFAWRDAFMLMPCYEQQYPQRFCTTVMHDEVCPNLDAANYEDRGTILVERFAVGGEVGTLYTAHLVVRGVVEGKYYEGGVRDGGNEFSQIADGTDAFYRGGKPLETSYATYQLTVRDAESNELAHYYLNSFPQASGFEVDMSFPIAYEKDIDVAGGGTVEYRVQKPNCLAVDNCNGDNHEGPCHTWLVPEPGLVLPENWGGRPLASWNLVNGAEQPFHSGLVHLRVTKVTRAN